MDVEDDARAKFDQWRVLAQNMLQLLAGILINDCLRLSLAEGLPTPLREKKLVVGDFATVINEAAPALMPRAADSYVPELVHLYGAANKETKRRRSRLQRIVVNRNRDAHTASLAQTNELLCELSSDVHEVLTELEFLRSYTMVAAKSLELAPDRNNSLLNGLRCHGVSDRYASIRLPIHQTVSRSEVILVKVNRSDWLSLRPWFLYLFDGGGGGVASAREELILLNGISHHRLDYVGLVSGTEYRPDSGWRAFTVYDGETTEDQIASDVGHELARAESPDVADMEVDVLGDTSVYGQLEQLSKAHENIVLRRDRGTDADYHISFRTPLREVAVATVDSSGDVQLFLRMLDRAVGDGLIIRDRLDRALEKLNLSSGEEINRGTALLEVGHLSGRLKWLGDLALEFAR